MKILLDTHILVWAVANSSQLSSKVRVQIASPETIVYVSLISLWELRIKESIGKISLPKGFYSALGPAGYELLTLKPKHIHEYGTLPMHHRDPFDRMLVAQTRCEQLILATDDPAFSKYDVVRLEG